MRANQKNNAMLTPLTHMSSNPAYSGDVQSTAIGAMYQQIFDAKQANVVAREYDGVGTPGTLPGSSVIPTQQAIVTGNCFCERRAA